MSTITNTMMAGGSAVSPLSRTAARIAFAGGLLGIVLLAALHVLKPDLDPSWHMVSEYALGAHGWVMALCFLSLALGCASLFVALLPRIDGIAGRIGLFFLLAAAVGLAMAAMYPMDPITVKPENASHSGKMHGVSAMIGVPSLVIAAVLLGFALRAKPLWAPYRKWLMTMAHLTWIALILMFALLAMLIQQGVDSPGGFVGFANRLLMLAYGGWIMTAAWPMARTGRG